MARSEFSIVEVDPADEVVFRAWFDLCDGALAAGRIDPPVRAFAEQVLRYQHSSRSYALHPFAALVGEAMVGAGNLELPLQDNLELAMIELAVPPEQRRRGVGSAMCTYVLERARAAGRTSVLTEVCVPTGSEVAEWPGVRFAERHGFTNRNTEIRRLLRLPVDPARLKALETEATRKTSGYDLVSWVGACPQEYAEQYAHLKGLLMAEAPTGDLDYEPEHWDVARLREEEDLTARQGRSVYICVAVAPDGTVAGHTQLAVSGHRPDHAYQWDTLVLGAHRGHRLGMALKVANLQAMTAAQPQVERVTTWNAEQNGPMIAVNEALGFEIVEVVQARQRDL